MFKKMILPIVMALFAIGLLQAQTNLEATVGTQSNIRSGPSADFERIGGLGPGTRVIVEGRNAESSWLLIRAVDGSVRGWISLQLISFDTAIRVRDVVPFSDEIVTAGAVAPAAPDTASADPAATVDPASADANATPTIAGPLPTATATRPIPIEATDFPAILLDGGVWANVRQIYARGQARGNLSNSFMKVGESNIAGTVFLCNFGWGNYFLGPYFDQMEPIVQAFDQTDSFCRNNVSAQPGFASTSMLDPTFAPATVCEPNETPIACEVRRNQPSYAFLYVGISDMGFISETQFAANLNTIIDFLEDNGVIPIVSTYPMSDVFSDGNPQFFNIEIRRVARAQRVPLIDIRSVVYNYENRGTGPDGYHLSAPPDGSATAFGGNEDVFARTMYEFLAMQVLTELYYGLN